MQLRYQGTGLCAQHVRSENYEGLHLPQAVVPRRREKAGDIYTIRKPKLRSLHQKLHVRTCLAHIQREPAARLPSSMGCSSLVSNALI
jgi:hypothetical protein